MSDADHRMHDGPTWTMARPEGWSVQEDDETVLFTDRASGAVIQINAYAKDGAVTDADLEDFAAEHLEAGAEPEAVDHDVYAGFGIAYEVDEHAWTEWFLRHHDQMLHVTYRCPLEHQEAAAPVVGDMLATLAPLADELEILDDPDGEPAGD
jgi:hypothetical protein